MEIDHALIFGGSREQGFVLVHTFLRFLIDEVNLRAGDTEPMQAREKFRLLLRRLQTSAMAPEQRAHAAAFRVLDKITDLLVGPAISETFENVVLRAELTA